MPLNLKWLANSSYITDISTAEIVMAMLWYNLSTVKSSLLQLY